mgnify:CR=1 FL=1
MINLIKVSALSLRTHQRQFQEFLQSNLELIYPDAKKRASVAEMVDNAKKYESADVNLYLAYCNTVPVGFMVTSVEGSRVNILNISIATIKQNLGYGKLILNKLQGMYKTLAVTVTEDSLVDGLVRQGFTVENSTPVHKGGPVVTLIRQELPVSIVSDVPLTLPADVMMTVLEMLRRNIRKVKVLQSRYSAELEWETKVYGKGKENLTLIETAEKYNQQLRIYLQIEDSIESQGLESNLSLYNIQLKQFLKDKEGEVK